MSSTLRPFLREIFLSADRRPDVYFYTSNIEKYLQARAIFEKCGLILQHFRTRTEPYAEDYSVGKDELLRRAIDEIKDSVGRGSLFFVEDTSIRIEALSSPDHDVPGLAAKEWFASTSFDQLNQLLSSKGGDRRASVKSDIGLHVPGLGRPVFFRGECPGTVALTPPQFPPSVAHPWLTPATFNGWLMPDGSTKRLGEMSFEESWRFDFRVKSLLSMIERLEEYCAALNLPTSAYSRRGSAGAAGQLSLLETQREVLIVVGRTCAGKTTMCEHLSARHGFRFFEASDVLRMFDRPASLRGVSEQEFAEHVLTRLGPDAVARKILSLVDSTLEKLAISGFRTIEELECLRAHFPEAKIVFVEASDRTRYERRIKRARAGESMTFSEFNALDQAQWRFGLLRVAEEMADVKVVNERTMEEFLRTVDDIAAEAISETTPNVSVMLRPRHATGSNQLFRSLEVLERAGRPLECGEIEVITGATGTRIRHNNVNKVLKTVPELATRMDMEGNRLRYMITDSGRAYLRLLRQADLRRGD